MRTRPLVSLAAAALAASLLLAAAPGHDARLDLAPAAAGVLQGDLGPAPAGDPLDVATQVLARHAAALGVDAGAFVLDHVRVSDLGTHVRGHEVRDGVRVLDSSAAVHVVDGRVVKVEARGVALPGTAAPAAVPADVARATALALEGVTETVTPPAVERWLVDLGTGALTDVWRVTFTSLAPAVAAQVDVDAATGVVLAVEEGVHHAGERAEAEALLFDPNPIVMAKDNRLRQTGFDTAGVDSDVSLAADALLELRPIREYDAALALTGRLVGPWVDVIGAGPYAAGAFPTTKTDPRFEGAMAYHHIDAMQRYFRDVLGLEEINAESQLTVALPVVGFDNSFYQPANDLLLFGAGGVDDAEDAEVIAHELGHAIHHDQVPGWGARPEGGAMGEGFGDLLAAAYFARVSEGFQDTCIMDWDAVSYSSANPPCLRRADRTKQYPADKVNQVHADGEFWSALLWRIRGRLVTAEEAADLGDEQAVARLASDRVLHLVLSSHELLSPTAEFRDAVDALRQAATLTGHPEWDAIITSEADRTGMPYSR
ncbi:MAG: M36 family metallopeptidase [Actinomycetes bacterium]